MIQSYHERLGIARPSLAVVKDNREASSYALLIVALIERGGPMRLDEVAERFADAGIAPAERALLSLTRCRPARPPIYRHGDLYELDVHDDELDLWLFRLGLRGPKVPHLRVVRKEPDPLPGPDVPLSPAEIERAFRDQHLPNWSAQRLAIAVLDAHGGSLRGSEVVGVMDRLTKHHVLREKAAEFWRAMAIVVEADGVWKLVTDHPALLSARKALREQLEKVQRWESERPDPAVIAAYRKRADERCAAHALELSQMRRVLLHVFPADAPSAASIIDLASRELTSWMASTDQEKDDLRAQLLERLADYDFIAALGVHHLLRRLEFDPGDRHLAELGPPQKSVSLNRQGRSLKITTDLLIRGSCGISRPFGDPEKLRAYLRDGQRARFLKRLEADAKSLFALYQYGRIHGAYRLRWGFLDEMLRVPWVHPDEPKLYRLMSEAFEQGRELEVVAGTAPGWEEPWKRSIRCRVAAGRGSWDRLLVDEHGFPVDEWDVQAARVWGG